MPKISRTFRLEEITVEQINKLQKFYSEQIGVKISKSDVIKILVKNEYESIDPEKLS